MQLIFFYFNLAARSLFRTPRRTVFNLLSISFATAAIVVFGSFEDSLIRVTRKNVITAHYAHYEITHREYQANKADKPFGYPILEFEELRKQIEQEVGKLAFISRRQDFFGLLNFNDKTFGGMGLGIDALEEKKFMTLAQVDAGVHLGDSPEKSIFVGKGLAESIHLKVGDSLTLLVTTANGTINAMDLEVTGIFRTGVTDLDERTFYVHQSILATLLRITGPSKILIGFSDPDELKYQVPLNKLLADKFPDLRASHWLERATFYPNLIGWLQKQLSFFYGIVLFISAISIVNIFTMGLLDRAGEFGAMRALGTHQQEIGLLIFIESMIQALLGSLLGIFIGIGIIVIPLSQGIMMPPPPMMSVPLEVMFEIPWHRMFLTVVLCTTVTGFSGLIPAFHMGRINIVKALSRNI